MNNNSFLRKPLGFEGRFTQFPNSWARDNRIGFRAKGVLILLMSHTNGWRISISSLSHSSPDGITAIRTAVQELENSGYLTRTLVRNNKAQVESTEWVLSDPFEAEQMPLENLMSENLMSENLMSGNLTLKNIYNKENNNKENNIKDIHIDLFEQFWKIYPRKIAKGSAKTAFEKACNKESAEKILAVATAYANKPDLPELQFIPHPTTWLNQERWNDDLSAAGNSNATTVASDILERGKALQNKTEGALEIEH